MRRGGGGWGWVWEAKEEVEIIRRKNGGAKGKDGKRNLREEGLDYRQKLCDDDREKGRSGETRQTNFNYCYFMLYYNIKDNYN